MYLPPLVFISSFLRPVIFTKPSESMVPRSPVRNQPSRLKACSVEVAAGDVGALGEDLSVVGDLDLDAGKGRPNGAELEVVGEVGGEAGAGLGEAVRFDELEVQRQEELVDFDIEGGGTREHGEHAIHAQLRPDFRQHQLVGELQL